jgi:hypothetical protein
MNRKVFNEQFAGLLAGCTRTDRTRISDATQDVYWEMLKEIPAPMFIRGVKKWLAQSGFFPSIPDLGEACTGSRDWLRELARLKDAATKKIEGPRPSPEAIKSVQEQLAKISARYSIDEPSQTPEERREILRAQARQLGVRDS